MLRRSHAPLVALAAALFVLPMVAGCGDDGRTASAGADRDAATGATLPFPPRAAEPPTTRGGLPRPAGKVIRIGGRPEGIAVDPASGLVAIATDGPTPGLALLDAATLTVRRTLPLPANARHVQASAGRFLVALEDTDELAIVDARSGEVTRTKVGDQPHDAAGVGNDVVVGDEFGGTVTVVRDGRVRASVPVDVQPGGVAAVSDDVAAVVSVRAYTVALLDLRTLRLGPSQNAGAGPSHVVAAADGRLFVADTRGGAVLEYATRPRLKALHRLAGVGAPYGLAIDDRRQRLWVTDVRGGRLLAVDVRAVGRPRITRTWPAVRQPNSVAVDSRSGAVFVAGQAQGLLQRVAP